MAIDQLPGLSGSGFESGKVNESHALRNYSKSKEAAEAAQVNQSGKDSVQLSELAKFTSLAQNTPSPNETNIAEIQKAIARGDYSTDEVINATASIIADQII